MWWSAQASSSRCASSCTGCTRFGPHTRNPATAAQAPPTIQMTLFIPFSPSYRLYAMPSCLDAGFGPDVPARVPPAWVHYRHGQGSFWTCTRSRNAGSGEVAAERGRSCGCARPARPARGDSANRSANASACGTAVCSTEDDPGTGCGEGASEKSGALCLEPVRAVFERALAGGDRDVLRHLRPHCRRGGMEGAGGAPAGARFSGSSPRVPLPGHLCAVRLLCGQQLREGEKALAKIGPEASG